MKEWRDGVLTRRQRLLPVAVLLPYAHIRLLRPSGCCEEQSFRPLSMPKTPITCWRTPTLFGNAQR